MQRPSSVPLALLLAVRRRLPRTLCATLPKTWLFHVLSPVPNSSKKIQMSCQISSTQTSLKATGQSRPLTPATSCTPPAMLLTHYRWWKVIWLSNRACTRLQRRPTLQINSTTSKDSRKNSVRLSQILSRSMIQGTVSWDLRLINTLYLRKQVFGSLLTTCLTSKSKFPTPSLWNKRLRTLSGAAQPSPTNSRASPTRPVSLTTSNWLPTQVKTSRLFRKSQVSASRFWFWPSSVAFSAYVAWWYLEPSAMPWQSYMCSLKPDLRLVVASLFCKTCCLSKVSCWMASTDLILHPWSTGAPTASPILTPHFTRTKLLWSRTLWAPCLDWQSLCLLESACQFCVLPVPHF